MPHSQTHNYPTEVKAWLDSDLSGLLRTWRRGRWTERALMPARSKQGEIHGPSPSQFGPLRAWVSILGLFACPPHQPPTR
eukprot:54538-Rhodomonas_salina.2